MISSTGGPAGGASAPRAGPPASGPRPLRGIARGPGPLRAGRGQGPSRLREQGEVREREGDAELVAVLPGPSVPRPPGPEEVLDGVEGVPGPRAHTGGGAPCPSLPRDLRVVAPRDPRAAPRDPPGDLRGVRVAGGLLAPPCARVARAGVAELVVGARRRRRHGHVRHVRGGDLHRVHEASPRVDARVRLVPEVPVVALLSLVGLRVARALPAPRRGGGPGEGGVDDGAPRMMMPRSSGTGTSSASIPSPSPSPPGRWRDSGRVVASGTCPGVMSMPTKRRVAPGPGTASSHASSERRGQARGRHVPGMRSRPTGLLPRLPSG